MRATLALALVLTACGDNYEGTKLALEDVSASTAEDTPLDVTVPLTANQPSAVTLAIVTQPTNGTLTGAGPEWTYTPNANYNGSDSFTVSATERSNSVTATVTINVTAVNDLPVAGADTGATTNEDTSVTITAATLLGNDTDVEASALTVSAVTADANTHGTVVLSGTDITYSPAANYNGTATFTYEVSDGTGTGTGTVTVTVAPIQDPPTAADDTIAATEDTVLTFAATMLTTNDLEVDGETMTVTSVTAGAGTNGTVVLASGNITWTGNLNFNGSATFDYEVSDGVGGTDTGTVTLTVAAVDDDPVAVGDSAVVAEDSTNNAIMVLVNDTDVDGGPIAVATVSTPTNGTAAVAGGGTHVTYTPNPNYCNQGPNVRPDEFQYTLMPGGSTGHVSVVVTCECDQGKPTVFVVGSN